MKKKNLIKKSIATLLLSASLVLSNFIEMPQKVFAGATVTDISAGVQHALVIKSDGTLWGAGDNEQVQLGTWLGQGKIASWVQLLTNVSKAAAGYSTSYAIKTDGSLWVAGANSYGEFGDGTTTSTTSWKQITSMSNVKDVSIDNTAREGDNYLLLKNDGTVWTTGGPYPSDHVWKQVPGLTNVRQIKKSAFSSFVVKNDNTLWGMGENRLGQLGDGTTTNVANWKQLLTNVKQIDGNDHIAWALKTDGTIWGAGSLAGLGKPGSGYTTTWTQLSGIYNIKQIAVGVVHGFALKNDGTLWCIGDNYNGQLGEGLNSPYAWSTTHSVTNWEQVLPEYSVAKIATGYHFSMAIGTDGNLYNTGMSDYGQLGHENYKSTNWWVLTNVQEKDTTPPNITFSQNPTSYTKGSVTITATATDNVGVVNIQTPGGIVSSSTVNYTVNENGYYYFSARDTSGNTKTGSIYISNIDTTAPAISLASNKVNGTAVITATVTDDLSGVKSISLPDGRVINGSTATYTATSDGTYTFYSTDNVGNVGSQSITITGLDSTPPTITLTPSTTSWTRGSVTISESAVDYGSGVSQVQSPNGTWVNGSSTSYTVYSNGTYTFRAKDNAGNIGTQNITVSNIDTTAPSLSLSASTTSWTKGSVTITAVGSDPGGSGVSWVTLPNGSSVSGSAGYYTVSANGTYSFTVYDYAGNSYTNSIYVSNIDTTAPTLSLIQNPASGTWVKGLVNIQATGSDSGSGIKSIVLPNNTIVNSSTTTYPVTSNGTYTFKVIDNAGNITTKDTIVSNIDNTAPTLSLTQTPDTGIWTRGSVVLNAISSDSQSGVKSITLPDGTVVNGSNTDYTIFVNGTYTFKVIDNAGNETTKNITVNNIDTVAPNIVLTPDKIEQTIDDVVINFSVTDEKGSGVKSVTLPDGNIIDSSSGKYIAKDNGTYVFSSVDNIGNISTKDITISNINTTGVKLILTPDVATLTNKPVTITALGISRQEIKSITLPDGTEVNSNKATFTVKENGTYVFKAVNNSGNEDTESITISNIDTTPPILDLVKNTDNWTKEPVIINATASDSSGIKRIQTPDGNWSTGATASYSVKSNGSYTFIVEDNVGNTTTKTIDVTNIDDTIPSLILSQSPAKWTNDVVVITAIGNDAQSGVKSIGLPDGTVVNGDKTSFNVKSNGTYNFVITDSVGNVGTKSITISNIDTTAPKLSLKQDISSLTNGKVIITAVGTDSESGVKSITLPDGSVINGDTVTYIVNSNGKYDFSVIDNGGNVTKQSITISNIDNTAPNLELTPSTTAWTKDPVVINVIGSDLDSGVKSITLPDNSVITSNKTTYTVTQNGDYKFTISDNVGNTTTKSITISNIDVTPATVDITQTPTDWTKGNVSITLNATDDQSGIKSITFPDGTVVNNNKITYTVSSNGKYTFQVIDNIGNVINKTVTVGNIDNTPPVLTLTKPTTWSNSNTVITATAEDSISGVKEIILPDGSIVNGSTTKYTVDEAGVYYFTAVDNVGNTTISYIIVDSIDNTKPTVDVTNNQDWTNANSVPVKVIGSDK